MLDQFKIVLLFFAEFAILLFVFFLTKPAIRSLRFTTNIEQAPFRSLSPTPSPSQRMRIQVRGSIAYWEQDQAFVTFTQQAKSLDFLSLFWYYIGDDGTIKTYAYANQDSSIIDFAQHNGVKVIPIITNLPDPGSWDSGRVEQNIATEKARQKHIGRIMDKLNELNFDGVDIDYEEVNKSQRNNFSEFIKDLASKLHKQHKILIVALHPKTQDAKESEDIGAFQDWQALGQSADQLSIMAYGQHYDESQAGPIAGVEWVKKILAYAKSLPISTSKFFLGISPDGYDWNKDNDEAARGVTFAQTQELIHEHNIQEQWNTSAKSPYFIYHDNDGDKHEVWFENEKSLLEKIRAAKNAGFGGITIWRLGSEDPDIWNAIRTLK